MKNLLFILLLIPFSLTAQDNLLDEIDTDSTGLEYADAAFKGLKIVNFESTKLAGKKEQAESQTPEVMPVLRFIRQN